jgi:hypothetical protein
VGQLEGNGPANTPGRAGHQSYSVVHVHLRKPGAKPLPISNPDTRGATGPGANNSRLAALGPQLRRQRDLGIIAAGEPEPPVISPKYNFIKLISRK